MTIISSSSSIVRNCCVIRTVACESSVCSLIGLKAEVSETTKLARVVGTSEEFKVAAAGVGGGAAVLE